MSILNDGEPGMRWWNKMSMVGRLLVPITLATVIIVGLGAAVAVDQIRNLTRNRVEEGLQCQLDREALRIDSFFAERARVLEGMFVNDQFVGWFENHSERGADLDESRDYARLIAYMDNFSQIDPA